MDVGIDSKIMDEVDPRTEKETSSTQSAPSSTEEWDRGTTYEYSPKESKFVRYVLVGLFFLSFPPPSTSERKEKPPSPPQAKVHNP